MGSSRQHIRLQVWVVVIGIGLLITKFVAFWLTQSNAILTDALESIVNVVAGMFALYSLILAAKPRDENHPYGHGKIEFISATLEGSLIVIAGTLIIGKSVYALFTSHRVEQLDVGIILVAAAGIINYIAGYIIEVRGETIGSLTMIAGGKHLKSDAYSTVGLIVGLGIIYLTDYQWLDAVTAIIFGLLIGFMGIRILRRSIAGIMDEADYDLLEEIIGFLNQNRQPDWIDIHNLRVIKYGARFHIDCHLTMPYFLSVRDAHQQINMVEQLVKDKFSNAVEIFIHVDDCVPASCSVCTRADCPERSNAFEGRVEWDLQNGLPNRRHGLQPVD